MGLRSPLEMGAVLGTMISLGTVVTKVDFGT
jgi:hypothetical protein